MERVTRLSAFLSFSKEKLTSLNYGPFHQQLRQFALLSEKPKPKATKEPSETKRKRRQHNILPTLKAFPAIKQDETVIILSNGATYPAFVGHPAYTPGKVELKSDVFNTLRFMSTKSQQRKTRGAIDAQALRNRKSGR